MMLKALILAALAVGTAANKPEAKGGVYVERNKYGRRQCTVIANGNQKNDVPHLKEAFRKCNRGGKVVLPESENYWIAEPFNPVVKYVDVEWRGQFTFSDDIPYWRENYIPVNYQNHGCSLIFSGHGLTIEGHDTGGIHGNGEVWYDLEAGETQKGRPMPFCFWNITQVHVSDFFVKQPPLWAINVQNSKYLTFDNILVNATAPNSGGANWVQNTDGFDTIDAYHVVLNNFVYQGGDDCIAIKERSYNVWVKNVTCHGGNGVAIGSLGSSPVLSSVENVWMSDFTILANHGIYMKNWVGVPQPPHSYEADGEDQGGGYGVVRNLHFDNVNVTGNKEAFRITGNSGNDGPDWGTSKMAVSHIYYNNFYGTLRATDGNAEKPMPVNCSSVYPCHDIYFRNIDVVGETGKPITGVCSNTTKHGVHGLPGC